MKKLLSCFLVLFFGFILLPLTSLNAQVVELQWNTFLGGSNLDEGNCITQTSTGNIYVAGNSKATWGSPINAHSGYDDIFVACLDSSGNLLWNTFLGSESSDYGLCIVLGGSGNIYVTGYCEATWGTPVHAHSGDYDAFVACLNSSGNLLWNTFLGSTSYDEGISCAGASSGNIYVTGRSEATWGSPINAHSGDVEAFVACLNSSGNLLWNTFLGSANDDYGHGITLGSTGNIYVTGNSSSTWGSPINTHSGSADVFVVCINSSGNLIWNTFLGSVNADLGESITLDSSGNIYVIGYSNATWGTPKIAHSGDYDAFVACLNSSGNLLWNTFLGSTNRDEVDSNTLTFSGNIYVTGRSEATWGSPINAHSGGDDAFVACLNSSGNLLWNTFLGSVITDYGQGICLDSSGNIYVTGRSSSTWGSPVSAYSGGGDAFVAKLFEISDPSVDIKANSSDGPISINESDTLQIRVSLNTLGLTDNVDYWLAYKGPSGWVHYDNSAKKWESGLGVTHQGPLMDLNNKKVFQKSGMTPGSYTFYFGVDMVMDGKVTKSSLYKDEVKVTVTQ